MPNYTNNADLPAPLVSAILFSDYDKKGDISVTSLLTPVRIRQLTKRHAEEMIEDVSNGIWRLMGSMGHKILERADTDNHLPEERLTTRLHGWEISGKADLLAPDMTLSDYKFTSTWAMKDEKTEWTEQLNLYAWLYRHNGFEVKAARIIGILRDWSKPRAVREPDYPQNQVVVRHVPLWSAKEQEALAGLRVRAHQQAEKLADDDLPLCTPEERWTRPDVYAVKKKGNKRATKLFETEHDAVEMLRTFNSDLIVEKRPGMDVRCQTYCAVKQFCSYGKALGQASEEEAA